MDIDDDSDSLDDSQNTRGGGGERLAAAVLLRGPTAATYALVLRTFRELLRLRRRRGEGHTVR